MLGIVEFPQNKLKLPDREKPGVSRFSGVCGRSLRGIRHVSADIVESSQPVRTRAEGRPPLVLVEDPTAVAKRDLAASQQAFQQLMKHFQSFPPQTSRQQNDAEATAQLNENLQAFGAALQAGDPGEAQAAFEQVRQQLQPPPESSQEASQPEENRETGLPSTLNIRV
jgi:hypothetical protein